MPHHGGVMDELLPAGVRTAETFGDPEGVTLLPAEAEVVARAVAKRQREFGTVRHCARAALAELGVPAGPILPGERGAPGWPAGVVGSMTHCDGYRGAAVARRADIHSVGIDAEPHQPLPAGVLGSVAVPAEHAWIAELSASHPRVCWDRLLFSAKESVYKAWYPLARCWLDFEEAEVTVVPAEQRFTARLLVPGPVVAGTPLAGFTGRWLVRDGLVLTAIAVAAGQSGSLNS
jgi:4'-phosphopantetheinyl transferase EntD